MTRPQPKTTLPGIKKRASDFITETRQYKVITPLFGGGVNPGEADPVTIVRATEIRGHLRFWWRATCGGNFNGNLEAMQTREDEIWGSSVASGKPGPSKLSIFVKPTNRGTKFQAVNHRGESIRNVGHPSSKDGYAAFALRERNNPVILENIEFDLVVSYESKYKSDLMAALWAWEIFGGIGARTRRGFGSLQRIGDPGNLTPKVSEIANYIQEKLNSLNGVWPKGVPHLSQTLALRIISREGASHLTMQRFLVSTLKEFRQKRDPDSQHRPFGRSKWPEPDEIRRISLTSSTGHAPKHPINKFPRAVFGLPIIFEFKEDDVAHGDPARTTLQGAPISETESIDRLASPLILRPVACSDGVVGLAAILEWTPLNTEDEPYTPPGGLLLKGAPHNPLVKSKLDKSEAALIPHLDGEPDVLKAFLQYLSK